MNLYLDIDGVLLDYNTETYAKGAIELIEYVTSEFDCYWLTAHCKGDSMPAIEYLSGYFPPDVIEKLRKVKPTYWEDLKELTLIETSYGSMITHFRQNRKC